MPTKRSLITGVALAGSIIAGGATAAVAATPDAATPAPSPTSVATPDGTTPKPGSPYGQRGHLTTVTGTEAEQVIDAITAANPDVTIARVGKDDDGDYRAVGKNSDDKRVIFRVSSDLATVTKLDRPGNPGPGGRGGPGPHTAVTGTEAQEVIDAVEAAHSGVTIDRVRKDPDGSYDAVGKNADGSRVFFDVSADLSTITAGRGPGGGKHGGPGGKGTPTATPSPSPSGS